MLPSDLTAEEQLLKPFLDWLNTLPEWFRYVVLTQFLTARAALDGLPIQHPGRGEVWPDYAAGREAMYWVYLLALSAGFADQVPILFRLYQHFCQLIQLQEGR